MFIFTAEQARKIQNNTTVYSDTSVLTKVEYAVCSVLCYIKKGCEEWTIKQPQINIGKYRWYNSDLDVWIYDPKLRQVAMECLREMGYAVTYNASPFDETAEDIVVSWG